MPKHHTCISFTYKGAPCSIFPHGYLHSTTVPARQTSSYVQALVRGTHLITDQHCSSPALLYTSAHKRFTGTGTGAGMPCCNAAHTKRRPLQTPLTTYVPRNSLIICMDEPYACQLHTLLGGQHHYVGIPVGESQHRKSAKSAFATKGRKFASLRSKFIHFRRLHKPCRAEQASRGRGAPPGSHSIDRTLA